MVNLISATLPVAFAALAAARVCQNLTVEVSITSRNGVFNVSTPKTNLDVTNIMLGLAQQSNNFSATHLTDYATVGGTYHLASTYCQPDSGPGAVLQILTHGIGFDRSYWDFPANNYNYSYVGPAVDDYGYSTFAWDRLGIAQSSRGEPVNEIQGFLELAALKALTDKLRAGAVPGVPCTFSKYVHVGHSFGSVHSYALSAMYPDASDGLVLTGFSANATFLPDFLLGGAFIQANQVPALADYVDGYLAPAYEGGAHINFFAPDNFDPAILTAAYKTGKPVTVGELLTIGGEAGTTSGFMKPVLVITGERDVPFCGGDCLATGNPKLPSIPAGVAPLINNASTFEAYVVPDAGHGLAFSYSHVEVTSKIQDFLAQNGLAN
ncbi:Alpha/Beta hydrolase protein [Colletotrichum godetiae]|uniref:Alpha/Beta hydrolase protein n=1 Tax=Colletotrichum godetiae TaxID=1209918 RepID=A0AAJ0AIR3_9PEZI|nr:Alpha/Beta hydrolase protein [Colletotrichum godetiae]KAK1672451.1 Alpha/Beta hydrolase protein [Colletotrichum godetiae]